MPEPSEAITDNGGGAAVDRLGRFFFTRINTIQNPD
jgi:hypothetical protein